MDRRRFLSLIGLGAAGSTGSAIAWRTRQSQDVVGSGQERIATSTGQHRIVWSVDTDAPLAGLTFDDGPDPAFTPRILDILDAYSVTATFFALGHNAARHPRLLREVVAAGHEVGSHGWRHLNLAETTPEETRREIVHGTELVEEHAEVPVRMFRPPYGHFSETAVRVLAERREDMCVWSVTRGRLAWQRPSQIASHVARETRRGDIVDLHDGIGRGTFQRDSDFAQQLVARRSVEIAALPRIVEQVRDAGVRFTTVSEVMSQARPPQLRS